MNFFIEKVFAATGGGTLPNPLSPTSDIYALLDRITDYLILIAAPIATVMILWGAFQILTAAGDMKKVNSGKDTIIWSIVGFFIVIISKGATYLIKDILGAN
ncbi:hypothetical protein COV23_01605 [Candidatus Wolfebacteria bacterium CG10_big_fil_rev_8_21_14_0_10_31_9]|uniref:TrbC/VirB2 family protein n=1 Tax=Candidatus Wolfebacteria bacterium CG10_big_fil_rev_8_21_14_0_10_31_9 TaxID=1975070 RepID=A0A2H0RC49_9BACT|nr:MAG: hypothetical protein COV23_01605 [Candidatus Wolfebacteria bacterium CG10_big_fil_rev_8_21_14_0_10_31_9]